MKKIYISPKSRVFHLIPEKIIAGSLDIHGEVSTSGDMIRRRMWMEDDEEEW